MTRLDYNPFELPVFVIKVDVVYLADVFGIVLDVSYHQAMWQKGEPDGEVYNYSMRVRPGDHDLGSLARTDALVNDLISGICTLEQARNGLHAIETFSPPYSSFVTLLAHRT